MKPRTKLTAARIGIQTPPDGFTDEEKVIARLAYEQTIYSLYGKFPTSRMKAIVALHFELGYTQDEVAEIFGISQPRIKMEIDNIRKILSGKKFRAYNRPMNIAIHDLLNLCFQIAQP